MNQLSTTIVLHLSLIEGVGPSTIARIIEVLGLENLEQIYCFSMLDAVNQLRLSEKTAHVLIEGLANKRLLDQELSLIEKHQVPWVTFLDPEYPELLKTIHCPPPVIYWKGTLPSSQSIAVVGARAANSYGKMAIDRLIPGLVAHGFTIVSGGAKGADTMAHQKTLEEGGKTVAVLGSGLLVKPYPPENIQLFNEIVKKEGAIVSCFPLSMHAAPENFPARNRVISGLSRGCIVIQAAAKSGGRITADFTLSQGREVFAVPGPITDELSAGCHELIGQGAKLVTSSADVLVEFGYQIQEQESPKAPNKPGKTASQQALFTPAQLAVPVDPLEAIILATCSNPCAVDELLEATGLPLIQLSKMLFELQVKGVLCQNMAGLWEKQ